jgi:hypothetical protein
MRHFLSESYKVGKKAAPDRRSFAYPSASKGTPTVSRHWASSKKPLHDNDVLVLDPSHKIMQHCFTKFSPNPSGGFHQLA